MRKRVRNPQAVQDFANGILRQEVSVIDPYAAIDRPRSIKPRNPPRNSAVNNPGKGTQVPLPEGGAICEED